MPKLHRLLVPFYTVAGMHTTRNSPRDEGLKYLDCESPKPMMNN